MRALHVFRTSEPAKHCNTVSKEADNCEAEKLSNTKTTEQLEKLGAIKLDNASKYSHSSPFKRSTTVQSNWWTIMRK